MSNFKINRTIDETEDADGLNEIIIHGAREHNLKNIDLRIPREKLVVITGLSGSGKSSLAFDTLYAEGQRRYVECLSAYARQYLDVLKKPDVDSIEGLSPAISIEQKSISHNPRSTVGTVSEIYDYLRLLFAKIGTQYCVECKVPVEKKSKEQIEEEIYKLYYNRKIHILSPLVRGRKGHYRELFEQLQKQGFTRVRVDGQNLEISDELYLNRYQIHNIDLVIDRLIVEFHHSKRLSESLELALRKGEGVLSILVEEENQDIEERLYSTLYSCPKCGKSYEPLAPNMFSFNSPYGACPRCDGIGELTDFDMDFVIPDRNLSINEGAIAPFGKDRDMWLWNQVKLYSENNGIDLDTPVKNLSEPALNKILWGDETHPVMTPYKFGQNQMIYQHKFIGILPTLRHHYENTSSSYIRNKIEEYMSKIVCPLCNGGRLKPENLSVYIDGYTIADIVNMDVKRCLKYYGSIDNKLNERELQIAGIILKEIRQRLKFLNNVGLSYLTLNRTIRSLSGGESQRIRLASQIGSELVGIMYVLDEPSIGLHQHDNQLLINSLKQLRDLGNTVIVVEHDKAMIEQSDVIVDIGPGAGVHGGNVIMTMSCDEAKTVKNGILESSLTAQYLQGKRKIEIPQTRRKSNGKYLTLVGASGNNLKNVTLKIPLGLSVCITGLSGSGKSSLINDTLYPILSNHFYKSKQKPLPYKEILGLEYINKVIEIDQSPIGRSPRSNPATYTGLFTNIRDFFAMLPESKVRGYKTGRFSFNVKGGRCEECEGAGLKKIEMNFLPEVYVVCEGCNGKRYNKETLMVQYKNKSIADVLDMTVEEALDFFNEIPKVKRKLQTLYDVGLTYIKLGQQAPTLSGGEAQRVKLATELSKQSTGKTLYLLDEPTTGLHFEDIRVLLKLLNKLVEKGNTVIVIEHNLDVIKWADWIIDLGPEGGDAGGEIIAEGTPEDICKNSNSYTGKYLLKELKNCVL